MVGCGKNCKSFVFQTMLFLKVPKTIIQESNFLDFEYVTRLGS